MLTHPAPGLQALSILANRDASRVLKAEKQHRETYERLAARHAEGADSFYTLEARFAARAPEIFPLRVVRKEHGKQKAKAARLAARTAAVEDRRAARRKAVAKVDYERRRKAAMDSTLALPVRYPTTWTIARHDGPNHLRLFCDAPPEHQMALITSGLCALQDVAKHYVSWATFSRRLVARRRRTRLRQMRNTWGLQISGSDEQWSAEASAMRDEFKRDLPESQVLTSAIPIEFPTAAVS